MKICRVGHNRECQVERSRDLNSLQLQVPVIRQSGSGFKGILDYFKHSFSLCALKIKSWFSYIVGADACGYLGQFDILYQLRTDIQFQQRQEPSVYCCCLFDVSGLCQFVDRYGFGGKGTNQTGYPSVGADKQAFKCKGVYTGQHLKPISKTVL